MQAASLRDADENNLTIPRVFDSGKRSDLELSVFYDLSSQALQGASTINGRHFDVHQLHKTQGVEIIILHLC